MLAPLMASDYAFSPINPDAFSSDGVASLFEKIRAIKEEKQKTGVSRVGNKQVEHA
ncbi:hypothetical protein BMETH_960_1 [methanotrophic bacterial endosymbiont of Bathymodiolus sp.]|nr:hypothetical protein BMETH_960_1 [methanotrophic bacterial endosymbiont of Bathymodiolus sp.]